MKLNKSVLFMALGLGLTGMAHAADEGVTKKITLTAQINDAIFVSKPDGSTWYGTEALEAEDYKQRKFSRTLPIRVWTKGTDFNVSLAQPLKLSNGSKEMLNPTVKFGHSAGEGTLAVGNTLKVKQSIALDGGTDEIHDLKISAEAPGGTSGNDGGTYSGDLVMVFEPVSSTGP
ncbi:MAG: CS1 type fimbrial major subunit [Pseudomonas sp.]|uniref:CS1 type fimbrial major subunit n=1 Tax=unclassified Pseudomonas TaxID=196821 RepID=UPI000731DA13|nr:CS1 type fimbrial major subunit [Pseudomonas sp. L5B5]KTC42891.1 fimbrial assembly protein [Pseudomonas sp. ABAC61]UCZ86892.1 fimbrial protein [Pseudomonas sp. L5B5]